MRRRNSSLFEDLIRVPWPVGLALGVGVVLLGKVLIPWMLLGAENPFLSAFGKQLATNALDPLIWLLFAGWPLFFRHWAGALGDDCSTHNQVSTVCVQ